MTTLGIDTQTQEKVFLNQQDRLTGLYVIGATGMGKSNLLTNMIVDDINFGMGLTVLDAHGDLIDDILCRVPQQRLDDVIYLNPLDTEFPFGLNVMECLKPDDPATVEFAVEQIVQIFGKVFGMSVETPRLNQYIRHIARALIGTEYTMVEIPNLLLDSQFRRRVLANAKPNLFWDSYNRLRQVEQEDRSESTRDRIDSLVSNTILANIVGQSRTSINFRKIMDSGKILLVSLPSKHESLSTLLGSVLILQFLNAALGRSDTSPSKRRQHNLYVDEFQRFAIESFSVLLSESRKFGIANTLANQFLAQLEEKVKGAVLQTPSLVCFGVSPEDSYELSPRFDLTPPEADEREKTIPGDLFERLSHHSSRRVKDFERRYLRKLKQAQKLETKIERYKDTPPGFVRGGAFQTEYVDTVYPEFIFDDAPITFNPIELTKFIEMLEELIFDTMYYRRIDHDQLTEVMRVWVTVCSGKHSPYKKNEEEYTDPTAQRWQAALNEWEDKEIQEKVRERMRRFGYDGLLATLQILERQPIKVYAGTNPDVNTAQQGYADRRLEVANQLSQLPRFTAKCRLTKREKGSGKPLVEEHLITTIKENIDRGVLARNKAQVVENTRREYCAPRAEIEKAIQRRQTGDDETTKRRG